MAVSLAKLNGQARRKVSPARSKPALAFSFAVARLLSYLSIPFSAERETPRQSAPNKERRGDGLANTVVATDLAACRRRA
jgi:hypothetical protein